MTITYNKRLKAYIVEIPRRGGKSMLAVKRDRLDAITTALQRMTVLKF